MSGGRVVRPAEAGSEVSDGGEQYRAYVVRMWIETGANGVCIRRFSVERIGSGRRHGFAEFEEVAAYLEASCHEG